MPRILILIAINTNYLTTFSINLLVTRDKFRIVEESPDQTLKYSIRASSNLYDDVVLFLRADIQRASFTISHA